jgi:hypothetical protein
MNYLFFKPELIRNYENEAKKMFSLDNMFRMSNDIEILKKILLDSDQSKVADMISQFLSLVNKEKKEES